MPLLTYPLLQETELNSDQNVHTYRAAVTFGVASISSYKGKHFTLTRTGVGVYHVQMSCTYRRFIKYPLVTWSKAAGTAVLVPVVSNETTLGTTGAFTLTFVAPVTGTATEPATTEKCTIEWSLTLDPENDAVGL